MSGLCFVLGNVNGVSSTAVNKALRIVLVGPWESESKGGPWEWPVSHGAAQFVLAPTETQLGQRKSGK